MRNSLTAAPARTQVPLRHLTGPHALDRALIEYLLERAAGFEQAPESGAGRLQGRLLATIMEDLAWLMPLHGECSSAPSLTAATLQRERIQPYDHEACRGDFGPPLSKETQYDQRLQP